MHGVYRGQFFEGQKIIGARICVNFNLVNWSLSMCIANENGGLNGGKIAKM